MTKIGHQSKISDLPDFSR